MSNESRPPKVLLRSEQSDGHLSVIESTMPAGATGPPLHRHGFDETLTFQVGDAMIVAGRGELGFAPRGVPHTLANRGSEPARFVIVCTPAGFEREFGRRAAAQAGVDPPTWATRPVPTVTVVGPRIGEGDADRSPIQRRPLAGCANVADLGETVGGGS